MFERCINAAGSFANNHTPGNRKVASSILEVSLSKIRPQPNEPAVALRGQHHCGV